MTFIILIVGVLNSSLKFINNLNLILIPILIFKVNVQMSTF